MRSRARLEDNVPRIGYFYSYLPKEIIYAFGRVPVRIFPTARNAADAEAYLHKNFCALAKVVLASFLDDATSADLEGVVFTDLCDAQRRLHDVWRAFVNVPVLAFLNLPRRIDALGQEFYFATLIDFVARLEAQYGQHLTAEALARAIQVYNHQRERWSELRAAWVAGRVATAPYYALRDLRLTRDPTMANAEIENALGEGAGAAPDTSQRPRLMLMGSLNVHRSLIDAIAEEGRAQIVAEDSACDEREVQSLIPTEGSLDDLLRALALYYLDAPAPRLRNLPRRLEYLARLTQERRVDGVICSYYKFCDLFLAEFPIVRRFFEARNIPVLLLEDEGDAVLSGQTRTRLQAFIEMLCE